MQIMCYFCIVIKKIKIMEKHYLTVEQMNNLQKIGLDCSKASFRYERQADEDDEDAADRGVLDGVERQRHPGQRADRFQHLDEGIERAAEQR